MCTALNIIQDVKTSDFSRLVNVYVCGSFFFSFFFLLETAATNRSLHDRGTNKLCSYHTRRLRGHGSGTGIGSFFVVFFSFLSTEYSPNGTQLTYAS